MGYCDGVMDESQIIRKTKEIDHTPIFIYGREYPLADGASYYGVKWLLSSMDVYQGFPVSIKENGAIEIYDEETWTIVCETTIDDLLKKEKL